MVNEQKRYGRIADACAHIKVSRPTLYRYHREHDDFPRIIRLSERCSVIDFDELDAWIERRRKVAAA